MDIKDSTVVRLIDRMEKDQFVERDKDAKDRRITYITLIEKGKKELRNCFQLEKR